MKPIHVIGGGLAGSEAAWQAACAGAPVVLHEMRPDRGTEAHLTDGLAELVCSNSFRSDDAQASAIGLLHEEMRRCGSLILAAADRHRVPAGGALAVDREAFSAEVEARLTAEPLVTIERGGSRWPAARGLGSGHYRHRAAHLLGIGRRYPKHHGRRRAGVLLTPLPPSWDRESIDMTNGLVSVAL